MRTAELIVKDYLERGYSVEALRVLAESRSEPLCSEMLAILDAMAGDAGGNGGMAGRSAGYRRGSELADEDGMLFFVADDDQAVVDDDPVDFDIMAEVGNEEAVSEIPADGEESVADILIGDADGAEVVALGSPEQMLEGAERLDGSDVWSRAWSRKGDDAAEGEAALLAEESPVADPEMTDVPLAASASEIPENTEGHAPVETLADISCLTESSTDYIPGSVMVPLGDEAEAPMDQAPEAPGEADGVESETGEAPPEKAPQAVSDAAGPQAADAEEAAEMNYPAVCPLAEKKTSRRERRRREKAERKKAKRGKKNQASSQELPEIILSKSEGSETLVPEICPVALSRDAEPVAQGESAQPAVGPLGELIRQIAADSFLGGESTDEAVTEMPEEAAAVSGNAVAEDPAEHIVVAGEPDPEAVPSETVPEDQAEAKTDSEETEAVEMDPAFQIAEEGDHLMIIAGGGLDLRNDAYRLLSEAFDPEELDVPPPVTADRSDLVIHFRDMVPDYDGMDGMEDFAEPEAAGPRLLHFVPLEEAVVGEEEAAKAPHAEEPEPATPASASGPAVEAVSPMARLSLLKACGGLPSIEDMEEDIVETSPDHVILSLVADAGTPRNEDDPGHVALMEKEYQERLDEFASRLLEAQAATLASEARVRERSEEITGKEKEIESLRAVLETKSGECGQLLKNLETAREETAVKCEELGRFEGMQEEHERLYAEFEDLRRVYNQMVIQVMPDLQDERDDLALTVERQGEEAETLRSSLGAVRRRLAAGYSLAAAACLVLVALPVANWLHSGDRAKELAMAHQKATEQGELLKEAERKNIANEKTMLDLKRQAEVARMELAVLTEKNSELTRVADRHARELAGLRGGSRTGNPSRTTENLALQASNAPDGRLRVNEVRDPGGDIQSTQVANRNRRQGGDAMARQGDRLRPPQQGNAAPTNGGIQVSARTRQGESKAKVKAGEGVAQVVYRVLGTRDPDVINWVIRENKIKKDRRGNPLIYENQELRLPGEGRTVQAASAARR